jgi:hypothetical protein
VSRPRFTPHLRSKSHDTWSSRFRLIIQLSGDVRFLVVRTGLRAESNRSLRGLGPGKDVFKQAFSYEHENHYLQ